VANKVVKGNRASRSSSADPAKVAPSSSKDSKADKVAPERGKAVLAKGVRAESVRVARDQVGKVSPSSSAGRALAATRKSNRVDKAVLDKAVLDKAEPDKPELAKVARFQVAQDQVDRVSPSNSARALAAARDNRVFPDNKACPSKVAQGRKACPVSRARPINSATGAPPLVPKADE